MATIGTIIATASLALAACGGVPGERVDQIGTTEQAAVATNSLTSNSLTSNSLTSNALTSNSLTSNALTSNSLTSNSLTYNALHDPNARELLSYIVSCALPGNESIAITVQGTTYEYDGQIGLAPEWGEPNGRCGNACKEWVSACLLARLDYLGVTREISVRGDIPALQVSPQEAAAYTFREATYFGNVFDAPMPQRRYACLSPGQTEIPRVCGPTLRGCAVDVDASCDRVCGAPRPDGSFPNCRAGDGDRGDPGYHGSITVFLKP